MARATGPRYIVPLKRRRKKLTDYAKRVDLLKSNKPRIVVRKSGLHILVQIASPSNEGDKIIAQVSSKELGKYKWPDKCNTPSAYLAGYLCGKKALKAKINAAILDTGLQTITTGNIIFAAVKGAQDAGMDIPMGEGMISEDRLNGKHIAEYAKSIKGTEKYDKQFSAYLKAKVKPEELPELFEKVKKELGGSNV